MLRLCGALAGRARGAPAGVLGGGAAASAPGASAGGPRATIPVDVLVAPPPATTVGLKTRLVEEAVEVGTAPLCFPQLFAAPLC